MVKIYSLRFQLHPAKVLFSLLFIFLFHCPKIWAAQEALVIAEKALVYSDREMTSPIGFISRGKKIAIGEIARNKGQVYPIVVAGRVAYIRVIDVTTEKDAVDSDRLTAERFTRRANPLPKTKYLLSYYAFNSQIYLNQVNKKIEDEDPLLWHGVSLQGEVLFKDRFDFQLLVNLMTTGVGDEIFRALEFGPGVAFRIINHRRFLARLYAQALWVPFSTYSIGELFRMKSYGATVGGGLSLTFQFTEHWGIEAYGGAYRTKLFNFEPPSPYQKISPTFLGARYGAGLNFSY